MTYQSQVLLFLQYFLITLAAYFPILESSPFWDDHYFIFLNSDSYSKIGFWFLSDGIQHALNSLFGNSYSYYYLFNMFCLSLSAYLLHTLFINSLSIPHVVCLLYLLHPSQVETVGWIIEFKSLVATNMFLLTCHIFKHRLEATKPRYYLYIGILSLLSFFIKPLYVPAYLMMILFFLNQKYALKIALGSLIFFLGILFVYHNQKIVRSTDNYLRKRPAKTEHFIISDYNQTSPTGYEINAYPNQDIFKSYSLEKKLGFLFSSHTFYISRLLVPRNYLFFHEKKFLRSDLLHVTVTLSFYTLLIICLFKSPAISFFQIIRKYSLVSFVAVLNLYTGFFLLPSYTLTYYLERYLHALTILSAMALLTISIPKKFQSYLFTLLVVICLSFYQKTLSRSIIYSSNFTILRPNIISGVQKTLSYDLQSKEYLQSNELKLAFLYSLRAKHETLYGLDTTKFLQNSVFQNHNTIRKKLFTN